MSRIGNMPIDVPGGTTVEIKDGVFIAKGPKGEVSQDLFDGYSVDIDNGVVTVARPGESGSAKAKHGLLRSLMSNAVEGVTTGFTKSLDVVGVGYRAELKGREVHFALGYSHPVIYAIPEGIDIEVDTKANRLTITGPVKQQVGQVAAEIRRLRKPDAYKGKGIRYTGEVLRLKVGKAGSK